MKARYFRIRKLPSVKTNWATVRTFEVNPMKIEDLGFVVEANDLDKARFAFDKNPGTSFVNNGTLTFGLPTDAKEVIMLTKPNGAATTIKQMAADGSVVSTFKTDSAYIKFSVSTGATKVSVEGNLEIYEIIFQ